MQEGSEVWWKGVAPARCVQDFPNELEKVSAGKLICEAYMP